MELNPVSPPEELEDGEICDDEAEESAPLRGGGHRPRPRKLHQHPLPLLDHMGLPPHIPPHPPDLRLLRPPWPRGPRGPDRPPVPPGLGPHGDPGPRTRTSFWERSHGALGRFRHRGNGGRGNWSRGGRGGGSRGPPGRYGPGEGPGNKKESPPRKQKPPGRTQVRKPIHSVSKPDSSMDESFEDLLSKYKQIQLELECIRKEETMALEPPGPETTRDHTPDPPSSVPETKLGPEPDPSGPPGQEEPSELERKVFQAFNIKPLRQKLSAPLNLDSLGGSGEEEAAERVSQEGAGPEQTGEPASEDVKTTSDEAKTCQRDSSVSSEDSASPDKAGLKEEQEELSELQLRLLALQSASKKWQQKEQQVMRKSKDRITKTVHSSGSAPDSHLAGRQRVTRSASSAAAAAADRTRTRSKPLERDWDRTKASGPRPPDRDRDRPKPKQSPKPGPKPGTKPCPKTGAKQSPKPGPKAAVERGRTPGKPHVRKMISPGPAAKQAFRKQQLRTWKLQQQKEQEEKRRQEEEERRKREEEIRRIRDLSNQDEQYNRFMKLVGGRTRTSSRSTDRDHRKSAGKPGLDSSGNLYQYDNYDEVAMDTDSETGSPASSPSREPVDELRCVPDVLPYVSQFGMDFSHPFLPSLMSGVPPPPPLPPPPDEMEPPPKPPFADEEEEEEMLLRETCLMSMANKRVVLTEEKSSSRPPSPGRPSSGVQPPPRGNLSTVSLNTVSQPRSSKFSRGHHPSRTPLVLPRHKSVVVSLIDSDDSDSDVDVSSAFGGLEFMIREARRTAEAAKPKAPSASEKENNPVRTPEALPESKKAEYRLLKEEIASREKQKRMKDLSSTLPAAPAAPDAMDPPRASSAEQRLSEAEQRLGRHRELLQRDEAVLRHLLQQELKKSESLKAAESKVLRLREQLQASEKIVQANRTLLRKLQEQVHQVEHRVSLKKGVAARLEQEVVKAQMATGRGSKRGRESILSQPNKLLRVDGAPRGSERHFAELMAQKQRLQQLESEYALKIQRLKETQALRNRGTPSAEPPLAEPPPPASTLPQPSLHDLTQDKLTLDSEDIPEAEDPDLEPTVARGPRRPSLLQASFTKPHLEQLLSTPPKDTAPKAAKTPPPSSKTPAEVFSGVDVDALRQRYQNRVRLGELLLEELQRVRGHLDSPPPGEVMSAEVEPASSQSGSNDLKPLPFGSYHSPLLVFRSYRFSPYYRTKEKLSLSSLTFSHSIQPSRSFCRFDLTGSCNDDDCPWQHMRNCTLTGNQLFQDILSYNLSLIGCSETSSDEDVSAATETYMKKLLGSNKDRMGTDQKAVLLVSKVNESKRHVPPFTTCKDPRRWRLRPSAQSRGQEDSEEETEEGYTGGRGGCPPSSCPDVCVSSEDRRYFLSETDDISNLESSVTESPGDTQLWIKLAFKYLSQPDTCAAEALEAALNTLSRALERNCDDAEVWSHYLHLFSRRGSKEELTEMCEMAVEHAPHHQVWWSYLTLETSFEGKDYVCERLLQFLLSEKSPPAAPDKLSFQLMEALLYRVELNLFTGRMESALAILQYALKSACDRCVADLLTPPVRAVLWLCFIHLTEFDRLPSVLFDQAESGPARLVSTESFLLPWRTLQDVSTPPDILIALFQDAVHQCSDESVSLSERTLACMPLHTNLIHLYRLMGRCDEAVSLCESLLGACPESCSLRDALSALHLSRGEAERAVSMWLHALAECPHNAEVFYNCCRFLMNQEKSGAIAPLFRGFVLSLCEDEQQSHERPEHLLRLLLGFSSEELLKRPTITELQQRLSQQKGFLHLLHCRWQWLHGSLEDTVDAFERALGSNLRLKELHMLWMDYLVFSSQQKNRSGSKLLSELVQRCLSTVPTRLQVPFQPSEFWSCYGFHNQVVTLYLSCLPKSQHALVLERLRNAMPNNTELGLRLLHQEWLDGNLEHLKFQVKLLIGVAPKCLSFWRIAIAVETELKERVEVRRLYQLALHHLPLCAALWKDRLLCEAAEGGGQTDRLRRVIDRCQQVGVSLGERVSLDHQ